jgi:uncharacterized protein (TIRG00374 family)
MQNTTPMAQNPVEVKPFHAGVSNIIKFILFLGLGILIIWLSLKGLTATEKDEIIKAFRTANYNWVILSVLLGILSHILRSLRWIMLIEPMGYKPRLKNTFFAVMIGYSANMAFPRLGEVTRCGILNRYENIPFNKSFGTVITERALDLVIFFLLFLVMIFTQVGTIRDYLDVNVYPKLVARFGDIPYARILLLSASGFLLILLSFYFIFRKRLRQFSLYQKTKQLFLGFWEGFRSLIRIRRPVLFIFYSLAIWALYYMMLYTCFFCFPETSHLNLGAGLSALILGSIGIMITPGGIGLYPAIVQETMMLYGTSLVTGLALGWIAWTAQTAMIIILGSSSLMLLSFSKRHHGKN